MKFQWRLSLTAILLSLIIAGCAPTTGIQEPSLTEEQKAQLEINQLLSNASKTQDPEASLIRADIAQRYISMARYSEALDLIPLINLSILPLETRYDLTLFQAKSALNASAPEYALQLIEPLLFENQAELSNVQKLSLLETRLEALKTLNTPLLAIRTLIEIGSIQETPENIQSTHDDIWKILTSLEAALITQKLSDSSNTYTEQGWFELYNELKSSKQIDTQFEAFNKWQSLWAQHPVNTTPPSLLAKLNQPTLDIKRIAILLPLEGKFAKAATAIKEGLLVAHFRKQQPGSNSPELLFLDSTKINTPHQLAAIVKEKQVDLVIGPLKKDFVNAIASDPQIDTPVLALNYTDNIHRENIYQFGLSAEDEAKQVAVKTWEKGIKNAALLTPDTNWGSRIKDSFVEKFHALGGKVTTSQSFTDSEGFSAKVSALLNTDNSQQRFTELKQTITSRKIEFEEHRRTDIDAIIITALPNDARQLSPIIAFNFAGDLPIYATSHVYAGTPDPIQDQDLNKVNFLGTPWSLKPASQNKVILSQDRDNTSSRLGRFYALGIDAYRIYPYLKQLIALPGTEIIGETGLLSLNENGQVERKLLWAQYKDGTPILTE